MLDRLDTSQDLKMYLHVCISNGTNNTSITYVADWVCALKYQFSC